ncbi:hypothetical protein LEP1GSC034_1791 [Leptospira interrogans str. 2003000735]|uniref:Uncharacterized protein n=6 Tax=Leptospira interrogans TaxID=173 RepID=A0A0E2D799_LEPIR|nr:hypothetical protein LEP1GSC045_2229 [Leptospira interrogans serovar Pomona str. Kennewicki LC82-25]EJP01576.1 hypothetical protein LEP1GSC007_4470 [Leptospira interrogans serovar Bulgarica str. Mallika]EJP17971.1 hypothetical protein LEP1GSC080_3660 [Leptospira interrogans str. FPW2026]EKN87439.1 hypothetical protein LEP1GSC027_2950 [Leptospira interrogans str. 2002000624]EKN97028.1 hypothetical protein LEP1GSC014_0812 [Leptospira interrogans serovar Pomona str. Pomona]EKO24666.1 hypotheti
MQFGIEPSMRKKALRTLSLGLRCDIFFSSFKSIPLFLLNLT